MKKFIMLTLFLFIMATGAFAMSIGLGGMYDTINYTGNWDGYTQKGFGGYAFFGINEFFEFNLGYIDKKDDWDDSTKTLQIGALFKYPIPVFGLFLLYPSIGIDVEHPVSDWGSDTWYEFWLRGGLGGDFFVTENLFLRGHLNYGVAYPLGGDFGDGLVFLHGFLVKIALGWRF